MCCFDVALQKEEGRSRVRVQVMRHVDLVGPDMDVCSKGGCSAAWLLVITVFHVSSLISSNGLKLLSVSGSLCS